MCQLLFLLPIAIMRHLQWSQKPWIQLSKPSLAQLSPSLFAYIIRHPKGIVFHSQLYIFWYKTIASSVTLAGYSSWCLNSESSKPIPFPVFCCPLRSSCTGPPHMCGVHSKYHIIKYILQYTAFKQTIPEYQSYFKIQFSKRRAFQ